MMLPDNSTKEDLKSELLEMSRRLKASGVSSIMWGVGFLILVKAFGILRIVWGGIYLTLFMALQVQVKSDPQNVADSAGMIVVFCLIVEGIVLLVRRRPKMLLLDCVVFCLWGFINVGSVGVMYAIAGSDIPAAWYGVTLGMGCLPFLKGLKSLRLYQRLAPVWQCALESLDVCASDKSYVLERAIKQLSARPTEAFPWQQQVAASNEERMRGIVYPACPRCAHQGAPVNFFNHWKNIVLLIVFGIYGVFIGGFAFWNRNKERFVCSQCGRAFRYRELTFSETPIPEGHWACPICGDIQKGEAFFKSAKMRWLLVLAFVCDILPGIIFWGLARKRMRCLKCRKSFHPSYLQQK